MKPKPPSHLSSAMKAWWKHTVENFALEEHHLLLLRKACEMFDTAELARQAIREHGLTFKIDGAIRPRPEVQIARDCSTLFVRICRELDLDYDGGGTSRPPALRSNRGR